MLSTAFSLVLAGIVACSGGGTDPGGDSSVPLMPSPNELVPGRSYFGRNGYVEYIAGDLPVVVLAPHGGTIRAADMPDRASSDTLRDLNTEELARAMDTAFVALTGHHPHVVICRVHRVKLDCNRTLSAGAGTDAEAIQAWTEFQQFIAGARAQAVAKFGRAFVVDMHGHGHAVQRLELGYLLTDSALTLEAATLDAPAWRDSVSVREMLLRTGRPLSQAVRGPQSLGTMLAARGYPSVPSASDPSPNGAPYFTGGYNTLTHGSIAGGSVSAVQIEANLSGVRDTGTARAAFARVLVETLRQYVAYWLDVAM
jgi:hypothetical protein